MAVRVTPTIFMEIIIALVAAVWAFSFVLDALDTHWDAAAYNNIFMVVVGSGVFTSAISRMVVRKNGHNEDDK